MGRIIKPVVYVDVRYDFIRYAGSGLPELQILGKSTVYVITFHQSKVEKIKAQQKVLQKYLLNGIVRV